MPASRIRRKRRREKQSRHNRVGGGNVLGTTCDLTPIRPEDFTHDNIRRWKTPVKIYRSSSEIPSDVTDAYVFNFKTPYGPCKHGNHNKVCFTTCIGNRTQLVLRESIRGVAGGGKWNLKLTLAPTDAEMEQERKIVKSIDDHINEMLIQCLLSVYGLCPSVYMIGVNIADGLKPYCVTEGMNEDFLHIMKRIKSLNRLDLLCVKAETLFHHIAHSSPFLMFDIKPNNLVYQYQQHDGPEDYHVYMIDFDTNCCIVDDDRLYSSREELHLFDDIKARIMTFWFYLFVCTHTASRLEPAHLPFFETKLNECFQINAHVTLAPTLVLFFLKYPHFKNLFDSYFADRTFNEESVSTTILQDIYNTSAPSGNPVFVAPPFSIDECKHIVEKRNQFLQKTFSN